MTSTSRTAVWTQRLVRQALAVPHPVPNEDGLIVGNFPSPAEEVLAHLVQRALQRGYDRPIQAAITQLRNGGQDKTADYILSWANYYADTRDDLSVCPPNSTEVVPTEATIFLLPIIALLPPRSIWPNTIIDDAALVTIAQSFRRHEIIDEGVSVLIAPHWFATSDLPTSWSGRRRWLDAGVRAWLDTNVHAWIPAPQTATASSPEPSLHIRWIVGIVVEDTNDSITWPISDYITNYFESWNHWESTIHQILTPLFPQNTKFDVPCPGMWTTTFTTGILAYHETALHFQLDTFPPTSPVQVQQTPDDTWIIRWAHHNHPIRCPWTITDDPNNPNDNLFKMITVLRNHAVASMLIQPSANTTD